MLAWESLLLSQAVNVLFSPSHGGGRSHYCRASLGVPFRVAKGESGRVVGYISWKFAQAFSEFPSKYVQAVLQAWLRGSPSCQVY